MILMYFSNIEANKQYIEDMYVWIYIQLTWVCKVCEKIVKVCKFCHCKSLTEHTWVRRSDLWESLKQDREEVETWTWRSEWAEFVLRVKWLHLSILKAATEWRIDEL